MLTNKGKHMCQTRKKRNSSYHVLRVALYRLPVAWLSVYWGCFQVKGAKRGGDGGPYGGVDDYTAAAEKHDILYFRYRLDLMHTDQSTDGSSASSTTEKISGDRLVPGSAVLVARRAVMLDSAVPMELGHAYGWPYWEGQLSDQLRWG